MARKGGKDRAVLEPPKDSDIWRIPYYEPERQHPELTSEAMLK